MGLLYFHTMKFLSLLIAILFAQTLNAQSFPEDWIGEYSGQMIIGSMTMQKDTVDVQFSLQEIVPDSSWTYKMTYNSPKFGVVVKDYIIRKSGRFPSQFVLDEQDSILIDMTLMNNTFYSVFQIEKTIYSSTMSLHDKDIYFDLFITSAESPRISRPTSAENDNEDEEREDDQEESQDILSHHTYLHQSVYLKRDE